MTNKEELKKQNLELTKQCGIDLTPQPSKLEQCIKEWEERGFIVENDEFYIFLNHEQYGISMVINKKERKYHIYFGYISLELNELLNKTLKAMEKMKNE